VRTYTYVNKRVATKQYVC